MTFGSVLAPATVAAAAAVGGALVIAAYILKLRRRRFEVPFSKLWQRVLREKEATSLFRKLRRLLSLAIQLTVLALLFGAALDPRVGEARATGRHVVVIVDASASMKARDDGPTAPSRIDRAREEARRWLRSLGGGDAVLLLQMDGQATALSRFETDRAALLARLDTIQASDTPADLRRALQAAADALRGRKDPMIVLIGDGAYPDDARAAVTWDARPTELGAIDLRGIDVRFLPIGKASRNVGITAFHVRRYLANKLSYEALVELHNFGEQAETVRLTLWAGEEAVEVRTVSLAPGERKREIWPDLGGGDGRALRAEIVPVAGPDAFSVDDTAWALLPERKKQRVLLVTEDNLYLEGALLIDPNVSVDKLSPAEYEAFAAAAEKDARTGREPAYDVIVFDGYTPAALPPAPAALYFGLKSGGPFLVRREIERPVVTDVAADHPVTRWIQLADVNIDRSSVFSPAPGDTVLASSVRDPLIVAGRRDGKKLLAVGFPLDGTDLTLRVAFPVLVVNALDWFAGDDAELLTTYRTGHVWSIPVDPDEALTEVTVVGPQGSRRAPVSRGRARFYGAQAGIYEIAAGDAKLAIAANLANPLESNIAPSRTLSLGGRELPAPPAFSASVPRRLWVYLLLGALAILAVEWLTYNRRITV